MTVTIHHGDNLSVMRGLPDASFGLIYLDPPFNTGRVRERAVESAGAPGEIPRPGSVPRRGGPGPEAAPVEAGGIGI